MRPEELSWAAPGASPFGTGGAVRVRWLGTAGFAVEHDGHVLLFDPYLTRASLARCVIAPLRSDLGTIARIVPRAHAIVVGHTHFDHALDVPAIALATGARVFGSRSAITLCRAHGVPEAQLCDVEPAPGAAPAEAEVGPFRLRFLPSAHSRFLLGRVPFPGDIADCDQVPMRAQGYRCGAVFGCDVRVAGRRLYHVGSAELVEASFAGGALRDVDLALTCVAGWTSTLRYPERLLASISPRALLLSHWDNFLRPIGEPARALPAMQLPRLVDRLHRAARDVPVGTLPLLGEITL